MRPLLAFSFGLIIGLPRPCVPWSECWAEPVGAAVEGCAGCELGCDSAGVGCCDGGWDGWVDASVAGVGCCDGGWDSEVDASVVGVGCCDGGWDGWVGASVAGVGCCDGG